MRDDHLTHAASFRVFLHDDEPPRFSHGFFDGLFIPGHDGTQVEQLNVRVIIDLCNRFERFLDRVAPCHQCDVRTIAAFARLTEWDRADWFRGFAFRPKQMFGNQKDDRILAVHGSPKQAGGVLRGARNHDAQAGIMREHGFVGLAVPQASAGQISSVGRVKHGGTFPVAERSPAQRRDVCHELIEARIDEIDKLQLEYRSLAVRSETARHAKNCRFGERRIENLLRKIGGKFLRQTKYAALWVFYVFTENDPPRIFFESRAQGFVYGIADSIFARRQNFVVEFWRRCGDVYLQFVRRRVFRFFRITVLLPDALLNFIVDFGEFFRAKNTLCDQLIFPVI